MSGPLRRGWVATEAPPVTTVLSAEQVDALSALANGIIPPDEKDAGAGAVNAAAQLAEKIEAGINAALYIEGLVLAQMIAKQKHGREVAALSAREIHEMLAVLRDQLPGFFKQLRMDISALYLSDPAVWQRIGFPGPSIASGGYFDFDQRQTQKITTLKETPHSA
jgi:Gluconate 2-dehydrogenase subunit 3